MKGKVWNITDKECLGDVADEVLLDERLTSVSGAGVLALYGDLGVGKTTFTQTLGGRLGIETGLVSPTFVVMKRYETKHDRWKSLVHIDAYRLESVAELEILGFADWLREPETLIVIEWADKVEALLPPTALRLNFSLEGDQRSVEISYGSKDR